MPKRPAAWISTLGSLFFGAAALAEPAPPPGVPTAPSYTLLPRTEKSVPLGTAILPGAPKFLKARDLARLGYVEEEYLLSGTANIYTPDGSEIIKKDVPYVTRMLLRRPANPAKWSGDIQLTAPRNLTEQSEGWELAADYMLEHGDVWIGLTVNNDNVQHLHLAFDPVRYASMVVPEDGFQYDLMVQVAWLLRSPEGPLAKLGFSRPDVKVISSGWSMNGALQINLINDGHHTRARTPSGGPVIDGYLSGINNTVLLKLPTDAAVLRMNTEAEVMRGEQAVKIRQADSDSPNARFRLYEISTDPHGGLFVNHGSRIPLYQLRGDKPWPGLAVCKPLPVDTRSGKQHFASSAYENLSNWLHKGIAPPPGAAHWIELDTDGKIRRDADGFAIGGLHPYWAAVPTSRIAINPPGTPMMGSLAAVCLGYGSEELFPTERLKELYPDHDAYVKKVAAYLNTLVQDRYLRAGDSAKDLARAREDKIP